MKAGRETGGLLGRTKPTEETPEEAASVIIVVDEAEADLAAKVGVEGEEDEVEVEDMLSRTERELAISM